MVDATKPADESQPTVPDRTEVLVIGGGIVGCSVAYHLTRRGITDVTVIEQGAAHRWHHLARGRPRLPAQGLVQPHEAGDLFDAVVRGTRG